MSSPRCSDRPPSGRWAEVNGRTKTRLGSSREYFPIFKQALGATGRTRPVRSDYGRRYWSSTTSGTRKSGSNFQPIP